MGIIFLFIILISQYFSKNIFHRKWHIASKSPRRSIFLNFLFLKEKVTKRSKKRAVLSLCFGRTWHGSIACKSLLERTSSFTLSAGASGTHLLSVGEIPFCANILMFALAPRTPWFRRFVYTNETCRGGDGISLNFADNTAWSSDKTLVASFSLFFFQKEKEHISQQRKISVIWKIRQAEFFVYICFSIKA